MVSWRERKGGRKSRRKRGDLASLENGSVNVARIIEVRVTPLVGMAESQGYAFLAYLLNMAQLEAAALSARESERRVRPIRDGTRD